MRNSLAMLFVAGAAGVASAQPSEALVIAPAAPASASGMWIDFGAGATRLDPGNGQTYRGEYVRFAPQVTLSRVLYFGAELDIGSFDASEGPTNPSAARGDSSTGGGMPMTTQIDGQLGAAKLVGGARLMAGAFSGGLELAAGVRYTTLTEGTASNSVGTGVVEARGRLDVWLTPHVTVGALAGTDLARRDEATFALNVGFHFEPFDHTRY